MPHQYVIYYNCSSFLLLLLVMRINLEAFDFRISIFVLYQTWLVLSAIELSDRQHSWMRPELIALPASVSVAVFTWFILGGSTKGQMKMFHVKCSYISLNKKKIQGSTQCLRYWNQRICPFIPYLRHSSGNPDVYLATLNLRMERGLYNIEFKPY